MWKSIPINSNAGNKDESIDVSMGIGPGRNDVFAICMCLPNRYSTENVPWVPLRKLWGKLIHVCCCIKTVIFYATERNCQNSVKSDVNQTKNLSVLIPRAI